METEEFEAVVLTCYYRPKPGGLCKRLFRAMESLSEAGHHVHYLALVPFPIDHPNCHFHRFPWPASWSNNLAFWAIFHFLAPCGLLWLTFRYRVTHAFAFGSTYGLFLQPSRLLKGIPVTLFLRADNLENHRLKSASHWLIRLEAILEGLALAGVRVYGVTGTLVAQVVNRHSFLKPVRYGVLPNDIVTQNRSGSRSLSNHNPLRFGYVGTLEGRKNVSLLIQCINHLDDPRIHLNIFGTGDDEQGLKDMTQALGLTQRITFMGWVIAPEKIWSRVDVLLFPSLHEGASNAVLEAIAQGIPVLASDIPEHRETLPPACVVPGNSLESWIQALQTLLDNPDSVARNLVQAQESYTQKLRFDWNTRIISLILEYE